MSDPLVSIVMPVRNGARWLGEAIDSALGQTMPSLELIVVDNGSTDETPQIVAGYAGRDRRVVALREARPGAAAARNAGIAVARGDWIASLDADDIARPERLSRQLALAARRDDQVLIGSGFDELAETGQVGRTYTYPETDGPLRKRLTRLMGFFPASSATFRRTIAQQLGGYRSAVGFAEDWDMWLRLAGVGRLGCVPEPLVGIRRHPQQLSKFEGGRPQAVHAVAATIAFLIRAEDAADPTSNPSTCKSFLAWVERRMNEEGYFAQRRTWQEARSRALSRGGGLGALVRFGAEIAGSGHGPLLLAHKLFGNGLARRLAREWARGSQ